MTGTSVKNLGSLMTFVSGANTVKSGNRPEFDFQSAMAKAQDGSQKTEITTAKAEPSKNAKDNFQSTSDKVSDTGKAKGTEKADTAVSDDKLKTLKEKGEEVLQKISEESGYSEEDIENALAVLGLSVMDLLDPDIMQNLVMVIEGEEDPMALVTNEVLFGTVKDLEAVADAAIGDLAQDMDMEIPDIKNLLEQAEVQISDSEEIEMSVETNQEQTVKEAPKPIAEIRQEPLEKPTEDKVEDEKGTAKDLLIGDNAQRVSTTPDDLNRSELHRDNESSHDNNSKRENLPGQVENPTNFEIRTATPENPAGDIGEVNNEAPLPFTQNTRDIMNQIMDYMRINVRPQMEELEMQLHPASLGSVKINLTNKAGEITAEFKVQNETVKAAMEAQMSELRETFKAQGTKVTSIEVSVEMQSFDSNLWKGKEQDPNDRRGSSKQQRRINLNDLDELFKEEASDEDVLAAKMMEANGNTVDFTA